MADAEATPAAPSKKQVFLTRLTSTLILWGLLVFALNWKTDRILILIACAFGLLTGLEFFRLMREPGQRAFPAWGSLVCLMYWVGTAGWLLRNGTEPPMWLDLAALTAAGQGAFLLCYRHELSGADTLRRIFTVVFGIVYTVVFFGFLVRTLYFQLDEDGRAGGIYLVLFVVMVTKFSDMGAYAFGSLFGKHKMIPHISPAKSFEGLAGAFFGSFVAAVALLALLPEQLSPLTWSTGLLITPVLCAAAVTGDLAESVLKRCTSIKDTGHSLPGIGGILDLTDSLLFSAPLFYFYLSIITH